MKKIVLALTLSTLSTGAVMAANYDIDPAHTYPHFAISHLGFSTMQGRFEKTSGTLTLDKAKKTASVNITIDAASISTAHKKRDDHLRSPDFLNVKEHPNITFKSTRVSFSGDMPSKVEGKLTIMGTTKDVTLNVIHAKCGKHPFNKKDVCGFDAETSIKRSDYGVKYGLPAIGDEMKLTLELEAIKK